MTDLSMFWMVAERTGSPPWLSHQVSALLLNGFAAAEGADQLFFLRIFFCNFFFLYLRESSLNKVLSLSKLFLEVSKCVI